ncbi:MAG TPA: glutamate-cysteine ligase family protein, partial [Oscillospiraceae bacterium]|nr:glutamate-cysteine ligase family protein [Oscillospiraceae bacterium]
MKYEKNLASIISLIRNGEKNTKDLKIGVEVEHIIVDRDTMESVIYYGTEGIEGILQELLLEGYKGKYENDYLVGLLAEDREIVLESGGQIEIDIKPCETVKEIKSIYFNFLNDIIPILEKRNLLLMSVGYHPKSSVEDIPFVPGKRYEYISDYLEKKGRYGHNMMKGIAALRVSIDYKDECDFIRKFRVANFISPLLYLISDNSPVFEGKAYERFSLRSLIWANVDIERGGIVPGSFKKDFGYKDYAEYILNIPPILIMKDGGLISTGSETVEELMDKYVFTEKEIKYIMSTVFPDIRVKNYIEIRVGDSLPYPYSLAYIALIKGIFYNDIALEYLYNFSKRREEEQTNKVKGHIYERGFDAYFGPKTAYEHVRMLFDLAKKFLNEEEKEMLIPLEELIIDKNNLSTMFKEKLCAEGIGGLMYCSLNHWIDKKY